MTLDMTHSSPRWMAVGTSLATDSYKAGQDATRDALEGPDRQLMLVFAGIGHDPHRLSEGIRSAAPGVPVIGCSTHGEINPDGPRDGSVVVTALGGAGVAQRIVIELSRPYSVPRGRAEVGASAGIALNTDAGEEDLVERADVAMYEAKRAGRGCFVMHRPGSGEDPRALVAHQPRKATDACPDDAKHPVGHGGVGLPQRDHGPAVLGTRVQ